jgi:hypothetical protein
MAGLHNHVTAASAIAAIWTTAWIMAITKKRDPAITAASCLNLNCCVI